jgi:hypothetical protein
MFFRQTAVERGARDVDLRIGEKDCPVVAILGIEVSPDLVEAWAGWLAPDPQPFLVGPDDVWRDCEGQGGLITPELRDTFRLWGVAAGSRTIWLSEDQFHALPKARRAALVREQVTRRRGAVPSVRGWMDLLDPSELRGQADGHRFVWWRSLVATNPVAILHRSVSTARLPSRHAEVADSTWRRCESVLPGARQLAGTFPTGSNENCFGTVMAAAGADTTDVYDSKEPFVGWLSTACRKGGDTGQPGTVLVWRDRDGEPVHAAVSMGEGWGLEKPSQEWHSPSAVATVGDIVRTTRLAGQRLERHRIMS